MKNSIKCLALIAGVALTTVACSSDYLNTSPENETGSAKVFETTETAALAVNGIAKLTNLVFYYPSITDIKTSDFNGEGTIKMIYGNWMGNHFVCSNKDGFGVLFKGTNYMSNTTSIYCYYPWWYYYMMIGNANSIIVHIGEATGMESERQRIRAQALTFRAYAYTMLAQIYCKRWQDSDEGAADGVVLRLDESGESQKLCTLKALYKQIYDDLNEAVTLFAASGYQREAGQNYIPDIHMAYAVYARAALNRRDYQTAASMARSARDGFPLMDADTYIAGFNTPTSEWIWSSDNSGSESTAVYSFFSKIAYNSRVTEAGKVKCISRELYDRIPKTDIRRQLFLDPAESGYDTTTGEAGEELKKRAREDQPEIYASMKVYAYMQFKFKATDNTGAGDINHFRSSEMFLIEAEAEYFLNHEDEARAALVALTRESGRDVAYRCDKSGVDLLEEIKFYRAVELWGEGFDWFDMKRWGDTIYRKNFTEGGNFSASTGFQTRPDENNNWCWMIPAFETDYNPEI